ncbi:peptidyl-prolyl cis-trans isomerase [Klebsiella pneumoniae]|nr:peptidyl-prolyl cis-trans isomerase [Klebsiella pneumoniae]QPP67493.1 peptidyl-prolyl cis-trans isomerase [Klebsiella pneumoniae]
MAASADDMQALNAARTQANQLVQDARAEGADFAELARRYSQDAQTVAQGGDLGDLSLQQLLPEARSPVSALKPGDVSAAIQSASGFHIIKLEGVTPARTATENEVVPQLRSALRQQRQAQLAQRYLQNITGAATLNIDGAALSAIVTAP